jgi:NADH dehydrogenase [ubiquinone] 1 alpha subcomplex assembly factor 5
MNPAVLRPYLRRLPIRIGTAVCIPRGYAVQSSGNPTLQIFNRRTKYLQRERAASNIERSRQVDYLKDEVAMRLSERLLVSLNASMLS